MVEVQELEKYRAPALDKGLDILELLAATEEGLSQAEIAKALDRSPNEIYRMLDRLVRRSVLSESDRIVGHDVDDLGPLQRRKADRGAAVV